MISKKKFTASRANSQKSTGPKTDEGKHKSAQNALKHGLYAEHFLLDVESKESYELHHAQLLEDYAPQTASEIILIEQLAQSYFIARRALTALADISYGREVSGAVMAEKYPAIMRIKNASDRTVQRCMEQLRLIAKERARDQPDPPARPLLEDPDILHKWRPLSDRGFVSPNPLEPENHPPQNA